MALTQIEMLSEGRESMKRLWEYGIVTMLTCNLKRVSKGFAAERFVFVIHMDKTRNIST